MEDLGRGVEMDLMLLGGMLVGRSCEMAATTAALLDMAGEFDTGCLTLWDIVVRTGAIMTIGGL